MNEMMKLTGDANVPDMPLTAAEGEPDKRDLVDQLTPYECPPPAYRWVRLARHCELTGDTPDAVHARRRKGVWTDGVQCVVAKDGNLYVNPEEWNRWIEGRKDEQSGPSHARAA